MPDSFESSVVKPFARVILHNITEITIRDAH